MKNFTRNFMMSIALCFASASAAAQYVTIPDANFVAWLNANGFASCMNGNQMDTTCSAVVNATSVNCQGNAIGNLTGISYFDQLTTLDCSNNNLTSLPVLPPSLSTLSCFLNQQMTSLPVLPVTLLNLNCYICQLTSLPALPTSLKNLVCYNNNLTSLPNLPSSLETLICSGNLQLHPLPALPSSLRTLVCYWDGLSSLPALPQTLETLRCDNNQLVSLPVLGNSLKYIDCFNNQLTSLPSLPDSMITLNISNNPSLTCLPPNKYIGSLLWGNTGITCKPNSNFGYASPSMTNVPLCIPSAPVSISVSGGSAKVCPGDMRTYTTPLVSGVAYNWTVPTGAVINSGQGTRSINVSYNNSFIANGIMSVAKVTSCGVSPPKNLTITRNVPSTPSAITGTTYGLCGASNKVYAVTQVAGMTYQWTVPATATIVNGQGTNSITVNFSSTNFTGTVSVKAVNGCGAGNARNLTVRAIPSTPLSITGPATACAHQQNVAYSTAAVTAATAYTWLVPSGALVTSGQGTTSIAMNYGTASGNVRVRATNGCGNSGYRNLAVTINCREGFDDGSNMDVLVYPNPSKNIFSISISNSNESNYSLIVRDLLGRIIYQQQDISVSEPFDFGGELSSGMYFAEIKQGDVRKIVRLIKSN